MAVGAKRQYLLALVCWAAAAALAIRLGSVDNADIEIIAQLRIPRVILATVVGAGLSIAGAVLQALFANPLCEPYTLGISSGSALGAVLGASVGFQFAFAGVTGSAFLGALLFAGLLYVVSLRPGSTNTTVLLSGVMLGFLGSSLVTLWIALADSNGIQGAMLWLFGDLSRARMPGATMTAGVITILGILLWVRWRELDALLMGEEGAQALGIDVRSTRRRVVVLSSILIGACVSASGMVGFVGLVVPHFARKMGGSLHRRLIPLCAIWGGTTLTLADCLARLIARPYELPVGVVTALVGAPLFLWIMLRRPAAV